MSRKFIGQCPLGQVALRTIYKLTLCAEKSFRKLNGFEQLAEVIRAVKFVDGIRETSHIEQQKIAA